MLCYRNLSRVSYKLNKSWAQQDPYNPYQNIYMRRQRALSILPPSFLYHFTCMATIVRPPQKFAYEVEHIGRLDWRQLYVKRCLARPRAEQRHFGLKNASYVYRTG